MHGLCELVGNACAAGDACCTMNGQIYKQKVLLAGIEYARAAINLGVFEKIRDNVGAKKKASAAQGY
jgi:hypothetical protein